VILSLPFSLSTPYSNLLSCFWPAAFSLATKGTDHRHKEDGDFDSDFLPFFLFFSLYVPFPPSGS